MPTAEQISEWTRLGHWPPPEGMTLLPESQADPREVEKLLIQLRNLLPPEQAARIDNAILQGSLPADILLFT